LFLRCDAGHGPAGELAFPRLCDAARLATMLRDRSTISKLGDGGRPKLDRQTSIFVLMHQAYFLIQIERHPLQNIARESNIQHSHADDGTDRVKQHGGHFCRCPIKKFLVHNLQASGFTVNTQSVGASMAHCLRRPLFSAVGLSPSFSRRCFSQLPALRAGPKAPQPSRPRQQADRSIRVLSKGMQAVPSDIGLLDSISPFPRLSMIVANPIPRSDIYYTHRQQPTPPLQKTPRPSQIPMEAFCFPLP